MKVAEKSFTSDGVTFPAGSFIITGSAADLQAAKTAVESLGLTAASMASVPTVATHDADFARSCANLVVLLDEGRVVEQGPPALVLAPHRIDASGARVRSH